MLRGDLYYADEPTLTRERHRAKDLCQNFNQLLPSLAVLPLNR